MNTCPDQKTAKEVAENLIKNNLAACVNILPKALSVYRWEGEIESAEEFLLLIKTREDRFPQVEKMIKKLHPYELPEIIAVPVTQGSPDYLNWLDQNTE